jgi:adenosylhomocysteine nucleosidase
MAVEVDEIRSLLQGSAVLSVGCTEFCTGTLHGKPAVVAACGVGKVNAALCAQTMLLHFRPALIVNVGVGGGLLPGMRIGDIAIASHVVQHDMDTSPLGEPRGYISNLQCVRVPCCAQAVSALLEAAQGLKEVRAHVGVIATGDRFVDKQEIKADLTEQFGAIACEMEGAAVGQVCALHGAAFCVVRAISDGAGEGSAMDFKAFARQAAQRSAALLTNAFTALDRIG